MTESRTPTRRNSRKALEYRVYWLERKLAFEQAQARPETVQATSPLAMLRQLHKDVLDANGDARSLITLTQQANAAALQTSEQGQRINAVSLEQIAAWKALQQQTQQLHLQARGLVNDGEALNQASDGLQLACREAIDAVNLAMAEFQQVSHGCQLEVAEQMQAARAMLENGVGQQAETHLINDATRDLQARLNQDSEHAAVLAAQTLQLNNESQRLHEHLSVDNEIQQALREQLEALRLDLVARLQTADRQYEQIDALQAAAGDNNAATEALATHTSALNHQAEALLREARDAIGVARELNQAAVDAGADLFALQQDWQQRVDVSLQRSELASQAATGATEEVQRGLALQHQHQQRLDNTLQTIHAWQEKANQELVRVQQLRQDARDLSDQSGADQRRLQAAIDAAEQINDDLLRGLQNASRSQAAGEAQLQSLMADTSQLQADVESRLSDQDSQLEDVSHRLGNHQALLAAHIDQALPRSEHEAWQSSIDQRLRELEAAKPAENAGLEPAAVDAMVQRVTQAMDQAATLNASLSAEVKQAEINNAQLLRANQRLTRAMEEQAQSYERRLAVLENDKLQREAQPGETYRPQESAEQQTLQDLREAMAAATRTLHETQQALSTLHPGLAAPRGAKLSQHEESPQRDDQPAPDDELQLDLAAQLERALQTDIASQLENKAATVTPLKPHRRTRQAVLASVLTVTVTLLGSLGLIGYQPVDAAIEPAPPLTALFPPPASKQDDWRDDTSGYRDHSLASLQLAKASIAQLGEFAWPLNAGIADPAKVAYQPSHQGITIEAELGDPVVAVNDGEVIYSDSELRGYGNMIVIRHDDNLLSVYANNQFNYVQPGDSVRRGQLIGDVGQLFEQNQAGLYFEIRYQGAPQDPFNYLATSLSRGSESSIPLASR